MLTCFHGSFAELPSFQNTRVTAYPSSPGELPCVIQLESLEFALSELYQVQAAVHVRYFSCTALRRAHSTAAHLPFHSTQRSRWPRRRENHLQLQGRSLERRLVRRAPVPLARRNGWPPSLNCTAPVTSGEDVATKRSGFASLFFMVVSLTRL